VEEVNMTKKVCDIVLYNGEKFLLDIRREILKDVVDLFIVKQANTTFSGLPRNLFVPDQDNTVTEVIDFPEHLDTWGRDRYQRGYIMDLEQYGVDDDWIVLTSDLDEVPDPKALAWLKDNFDDSEIYSFEQTMFQFYLNVVNTSEPWAGTRACSLENYKKIDAETLRQRYMTNVLPNAGWHWSFLGGKEMVERKIQSYAHQEYNNEFIIKDIHRKMNENKDVFERGFVLRTVTIDDSFPEYIVQNQDKLSKYIKKV
jgi:beta-1,4-mannosyl-glycoprotein beta-1,4-N-acetylglucosaminyltransferase